MLPIEIVDNETLPIGMMFGLIVLASRTIRKAMIFAIKKGIIKVENLFLIFLLKKSQFIDWAFKKNKYPEIKKNKGTHTQVKLCRTVMK